MRFARLGTTIVLVAISGGSMLLLPNLASAGPSCKAAIADAEQAWRASSCIALEKSLSSLKSTIKGGCSDANELALSTQVARNLEASLEFRSCGCEPLRSLVETVRRVDPANVDCSKALDIVGQLRSHGKCKDEHVRADSKKAEGAYLMRVSKPDCQAICTGLPERIATLPDTSKERPKLKAQCIGCPGEIQQKCKGSPSPRSDTTSEKETVNLQSSAAERLASFRTDLASQNKELQSDQTCNSVSGCTDRERRRLEKLTAYLELLHVAKLTKSERDAEEASARTVLRGIGLKDDVVNAILGLSADELQGVATLSSKAGNAETRKLLADQLQVLDSQQFGELAAAIRDGVSLVDIMKKASDLKGDHRRNFFRTVSLGMDETRLREAYLRQLLENQFEIVRPKPRRSTECTGCDEFWSVFSREIELTQPPRWSEAEDVTSTFTKRVQERKSICGSPSSRETSAGCGAVMSVTLDDTDAQNVVVAAELDFVIRTAKGVEVRVRKLDPVSFSNGRNESRRQQSAAKSLATSAAFAFDRLRGSEVVTTNTPKLFLAPNCGVSVTIGDNLREPPPSSGSITAVGNCENAEFRDALIGGLRGYGLEESLVFSQSWPSAKEEAELKCTVTLRAGSSVLEDMFSVAAFVLPSEQCGGAQIGEKWHHAGEQAALRIARYMAMFQAPRQVPPFSHALHFSGARQLEYSNGRSGWGWALGETGLLVATAVFAGLAVNARNNVPTGSSDVGTANTYMGIAASSLLLVIPLRLGAGFAFSPEAHNDNAR